MIHQNLKKKLLHRSSLSTNNVTITTKYLVERVLTLNTQMFFEVSVAV